MATIWKEDFESLARQLLHDRIDRSAWHHSLSEEERGAAIAADVEAWWHLKAGEAAQILVEGAIAEQMGWGAVAGHDRHQGSDPQSSEAQPNMLGGTRSASP